MQYFVSQACIRKRSVSSFVNVTPCKDRRNCFDSFQDFPLNCQQHACNKKLCNVYQAQQKLVALLSNCCFQSGLFFLTFFNIIKILQPNRVSCVGGKLLCAHGKHRVFSQKSCFLINTEVKRRILSCWDKVLTSLSGLSPLKASGWLLPVVCDGLPQFTQDPASDRIQRKDCQNTIQYRMLPLVCMSGLATCRHTHIGIFSYKAILGLLPTVLVAVRRLLCCVYQMLDWTALRELQDIF